jgi:hypothetical protein
LVVEHSGLEPLASTLPVTDSALGLFYFLRKSTDKFGFISF